MKTLFLVIPRRISVRYILSSDVWDELKEISNLRIVILTSIIDIKFVKEFSAPNVIVEHIPMRDGKENLFEKLNRSLRSYLGSLCFDLETLNAKAKMNGKIVWLAYRCLVKIAHPFLFLRNWLRWLDVYFFSLLFDKKYEALFSFYKPDLVFIHSVQELTAVPIARVANRKKVLSIGVVLSWDNVTNKGEIFAHCDQLIVWNEIVKRQVIDYHDYQEKDVFVIGTPQFDFFIRYNLEIPSKNEFFEKLGLDKNKKLILYTTVPERIGGDNEIKSINAIHEAIINHNLIMPAQLLVRIYTKDNPLRYQGFVNLSDLILYDPGKDNQNLSYREIDKYFSIQLAAMIKYADVVVNIASTTSIDAAIFNRPIINVALGWQNYWYETSHYKHLVNTGGVKMVNNLSELIMGINQYLENPLLDEEGRKRIVSKICYKVDGNSGKRLIEILYEKYLHTGNFRQNS